MIIKAIKTVYNGYLFRSRLEVDEIRNNINDLNVLWKQLFGYEQKQYVMRGSE